MTTTVKHDYEGRTAGGRFWSTCPCGFESVSFKSPTGAVLAWAAHVTPKEDQ